MQEEEGASNLVEDMQHKQLLTVEQIRCDAPDESGRVACSSCKRTAVQCLFSRQPMKRGPSKGYRLGARDLTFQAHLELTRT